MVYYFLPALSVLEKIHKRESHHYHSRFDHNVKCRVAIDRALDG
ncbi:hypothetical protein NMD1_04132 [Novosphingobium sp. MD-1]|nr:hypothetical protein NMD1_04132 [Novosphingobium sp. MD-1]